MTMRTGPVPPDITAAVETYVRSELTAAATYDNRTPLDDAGVFSLRRLVERTFLAGYDAGWTAGVCEASFGARELPDLLAKLHKSVRDGGE
jgi:hypothetical protein